MTGFQSKKATAQDKPLTKEHGFQNYAHQLMVKCFNEKLDEHLEKNMTGYKSKKAAAQDELAQPAQEPWKPTEADYKEWCDRHGLTSREAFDDAASLYLNATPPAAQRTWVGLTNDELLDCWNGYLSDYQFQNIREIEAKLKEKNT